MFPPKKMHEDEDLDAISGLMAGSAPEAEEAPPEAAGAQDPMALVAAIEQKLAELKAAVA